MNHNVNLLTVLLAGSLTTSIHAVGSDFVGQTRELVVTAVTRAAGVGCRNVDIFTDNYLGLRDKLEFLKLRERLNTSWETALSNINVIAETDMEKAVLLYSFEELSERDYISFLRVATGLVEQGKLKRDLYYTIQCPLSETSDAWAVLARKYDDDRVRDVITRSKKIFADLPDRLARYDLMLTGESCKKLKRYAQVRCDNKGSDAVQRKQAHEHQKAGSINANLAKLESMADNAGRDQKSRGSFIRIFLAVAFSTLAGVGIFALIRKLKKK